MRVDVKICGLTRPEDASAAAALGASRLGVIFAGGPRLIDRARAAEIVAAGNGVPVIGVFGRQGVTEIIAIAEVVGLSGIQLHRASTLAETLALQAAGFAVWRIAHLTDQQDLGAALATMAEAADVLLLEPKHPDGGGGRGVALPLDLAQAARRELCHAVVALAGGLTPETVSQAIQVVAPNIVDVSSGVESAPGIKSRDQVERFLERVRDASTSR